MPCCYLRLPYWVQMPDCQCFMKRATFLAAFIVLAATACKTGSNWAEIEKLQAEVEAIHDAPMMKIDELESLQNRAGKELATAPPARVAELKTFITESQAAHDAMFDWMAQYRAPEKGKTDPKAALDYLNQQKTLAQKMSEQVMGAVENGRKLMAAN